MMAQVGKPIGEYSFALDSERVCAALRQMAQDIETGLVLVNSVTQTTRNTKDDYEVKHLVVRYHRKRGG